MEVIFRGVFGILLNIKDGAFHEKVNVFKLLTSFSKSFVLYLWQIADIKEFFLRT